MDNTHLPFISEFVPVRGLQYHVRRWGRPDAPMLFMVHGWMDMSASFQFIADLLARDWQIVAPDWRGFGLTQSPGADSYWYPDYIADLDFLLRHYSPDEPVNLLGHSMGGNIVMHYAGVRPQRVRKLINLEGFGMPLTEPAQAPGRIAKWLDELADAPTLRSYATREEVAARLQKTNPRLSNERADFLSRYWSAPNADGRWEILGDPAHKLASPLLYHVEEAMACWSAIAAPVLWIEADQTRMWEWIGEKEWARREIDRRIAHIPKVLCETVQDAGHMVHHDQPEVLARLIGDFIGAPD